MAAAPAAAAACSASSTSSVSPGPRGDEAADAANDAGSGRLGADASVAIVNGCTGADFAANDRTADDAERIIQGPTGPTPAQFSPHCMRVRVGQTVTWKGDLGHYSLSYKFVSTSPEGPSDAATVVVLGDRDGGASQDTVMTPDPTTIAFTCDDYPTIMFGAVDVVAR